MLSSSRGFALLLCAAAMSAPWGESQPLPGRAAPPHGAAPSRKKAKSGATAARRLMLVDATAAGPDGAPDRTLTPADFTLSLSGNPATIAAVNYVDAVKGTISPASASLALTPDQIHRTLILVVDDLDLSQKGAANVRNLLAGFVGNQMRETDLVSVYRTSYGAGWQQTPTSDHKTLAEAIDQVRYHPAGATPEQCAAGARGALRLVLAGLHGLEGRKGVVVLSENGALFEKAPSAAMIEAADRAGAVVSLLDLRGAAAPAVTAAGMAELARQTGGRFATRTDDIAPALAEAFQDQDGYYLVAYEVEDPLGGSAGLAAQHPMLASTRPGVALRARPAAVDSALFTSDPARTESWRPSFTTPAADLLRGIANPFASGTIPIHFVAVYTVGKTGTEIVGLVEIDARDLTYTRLLNGRTTATLDTQIATFNENGQTLQNSYATYDVQLSADQYQASSPEGFTASLKLAVRVPGAYQVRVAVRDGASGRVGSAGQFVNAFDVAGGRLAITGITISDQGQAKSKADVFHVLQPGDEFHYEYQIVNLAADSAKRSRIQSSTRILHDGFEIFQGEINKLDFAAADDPKTRTAGGAIKLGQKFPPGYYVLEIQVTDMLAKQPATVTQYVRFEVTT